MPPRQHPVGGQLYPLILVLVGFRGQIKIIDMKQRDSRLSGTVGAHVCFSSEGGFCSVPLTGTAAFWSNQVETGGTIPLCANQEVRYFLFLCVFLHHPLLPPQKRPPYCDDSISNIYALPFFKKNMCMYISTHTYMCVHICKHIHRDTHAH